MRKLNLKDYTITVKEKTPLGDLIDAEYPYPVKDSILNLLFIRELQLSGADLVKQNVLAMKLEQCKDSEILLEDEEWGRIKLSIDTFKGFNRGDVELVIRINKAEVVEVKSK